MHLCSKRLAQSSLVFAIAALLLPPGARADSFTFSTLPSSGSVGGSPGATIGWGFSITNQSSSDWLITTNLNADPFLRATPTLLFAFPIVAPGQTVTESFSPAGPHGLYDLIWDTDAPSGFVNSGDFVLSAQWWTGDPANGGALIADAPDSSIPYSATVNGASVVPEPSNWALLLCAAAVLWAARRRRF